MKMYDDPEWAKIDEDELEDNAFDEEDDLRKKKGKNGEEFYCVACNKKFKSDKQWKNHEQSKKHKDKVAELKDAFDEEDEVFEDVDDGVESVHVGFEYVPLSEDEDSDPVELLCDELKDEVVLEEKAEEEEKVEEDEMEGGDPKLGLDSDEVEATVLEAMLSRRRNKKSGHVFFEDSSLDMDVGLDDDEDGSMGSNTRRKGRKNRGRRRADGEGVRGEASETQQNEDEVRHQDQAGGDSQEGNSGSNEEVVARNKGNRGDAKSQKQKKQPVARKSSDKKETDYDVKNSSKGRKQKGGSKAPINECGTCGESFDSRNKLFAHLGDSGHAMLKSR
ncbi:hypothetical protein J5N97_015951 [Dioscorea zingiberensis]|uniref:C2H2-type domain-containing protein n=1 Tax=Dioscorea zingiberensis TaxID=325984 RepID=A0A9D5CIH3_9LILI|nr:hypothetical protein J5N97_015951 [Dioscorea zingiberensis]